jgi:excinuclease ABC subunit A
MAKLQHIEIIGARTHNLKNIHVKIPRNRLVVVTGVSGSGKSSLVFDTLYAEGHRRYVESLSAYARQFLARMDKPDVDYIHGISPAIAIEQRVISNNARSTVGSVTEIYDYLRLLFARIGVTYSPISGEAVRQDSITDIIDFICSPEQPAGQRMMILAPLITNPERSLMKEFEITLQKGFTRLWYDEQAYEIEQLLEQPRTYATWSADKLLVLIDRFQIDPEEITQEDFRFRLADSLQTAYNEGLGNCTLWIADQNTRLFSEAFEADGITFELPSDSLFNFNKPTGACPSCEGTGQVLGFVEELVIPNSKLSVAEGAVSPWNIKGMGSYLLQFCKKAKQTQFPIEKPYQELTQEQKDFLWNSESTVFGIIAFFNALEKQPKVQHKIILNRYRGKTVCPSCSGGRLRKEALYVKIHGTTIADLLAMPIDNLHQWFEQVEFSPREQQVGQRLILEIRSRLNYLRDVGLGYLSLGRAARTLSGGETQRINLATSLGSNLVGSLYILDEPSIGLHPRDTDRLISVLESLRDLGNTVIVVEHDESIMRRADHLIDMGPRAGEHGGAVICQGTYDEVTKAHDSLTADYLTQKLNIPVPVLPRDAKKRLIVRNAHAHNLKQISPQFALNCFNVVTGVSGSGKTTLIKEVLYPLLKMAIAHRLAGAKAEIFDLNAAQYNSDVEMEEDFRAGRVSADGLEGFSKDITGVELVDQQAIARNARSNPVTYIGAYDAIRNLFAETEAAKLNYIHAAYFSFNVPGGRCETCGGEGVEVIEMQFLPDVRLKCETCKGKRFKDMILQIQYKDRNIFQVLDMTVDESLTFFKDVKRIHSRIQVLQDVGLGYLRLGQSTTTLSGGEAQRLKLASFLQRRDSSPHIYIFDEPTTGLHFDDVRQLLIVFEMLMQEKHTIIVIEHNLDIIKYADWLVELGPEGGQGGGNLVFEGRPRDLLKVLQSVTAPFLKEKFS